MQTKDLFGDARKDYNQEDVTNSLTQAILKYLRLKGAAAFRVNTSGLPMVINGRFLGFRKSTNPGAADIRAIYKGYSIDIEVKSQSDKLNENQISFKQKIEEAKGQYWEVRSFDEFLNFFNYFTKNL